MAKTKSFAEKMMKSGKPKEEYDSYKVINAKLNDKSQVKYDTKIVKIHKGDDEVKALGL